MTTITSNYRHWTNEEELFLRQHAASKPAKEIAATLGRSYNALRMRAGQRCILLTSRLQKAGEFHKFPCGCEGVLPKNRGESNLLAKSNKNTVRTRSWVCRILQILRSSKRVAEEQGYKPIKATHGEIRELMKDNKCWLCKNELVWELGKGSTPHLHHDHESGKVYGFTHSRCNPRALQNEIIRLRKRLDNCERI